VIVDFFTKFKILVACHSNDTSKDLANIFIQKVFGYFGTPKEIVSDRGTTFVSKFTRAVWKQLSVKPLPSTAFHPQTNGQTERVNQELEQYLRFYCNFQQDNWATLLPLAQFTLNTRYHSATNATPFTLMFGYTPNWSHLDIETSNPQADEFTRDIEDARKNTVRALTKAAEVMKEYYDRKKSESPSFKIGDKVLLESKNITPIRPMRKLSELRYGPFEIEGKIGNAAYRLKLPPSWNAIHPVFNESLLIPFHPPLPSQRQLRPPPIPQQEGEAEYEVEQIIDKRQKGKKIEYLVKWKGYNHDENTWEPKKNLANASEILQEFERSS
jgi:hypothetical protein